MARTGIKRKPKSKVNLQVVVTMAEYNAVTKRARELGLGSKGGYAGVSEYLRRLIYQDIPAINPYRIKDNQAQEELFKK